MDGSSALQRLRGTTGLWSFAHETVAPAAAGEVAALIEELGFSALWYPEAFGRESLTSASLLLAGSSSLVIGSSIASIWARDAMAASAAAKTLSEMSHDRFVLGLGVSHKPMVERTRGHDYQRPLAAMDAYLDALDATTMFAAEAAARPPRLIAALGPAMLALARDKADGAIPYLVTPEHTELARSILGPDAFLGVEQAVVLSDDAGVVAERAAAHLHIYTGLPNYQNSWRRLGFSDDDFVPGGSRRLQQALVVSGDEDAVAARVADHMAAGADHVCLQVLGPDAFGVPEEDWRRLGPAAR